MDNPNYVPTKEASRFCIATVAILAVALGLVATGAAQSEKVIYTFTADGDGQSPQGTLSFDSAGNLYGSALYGGLVGANCSLGCGTIFELSPNLGGGWNESTLYQFTGGSDGRDPQSTLIFDAAGNLYGMGTNMAFELSPTSGGWAEAVIHSFTGGKDGGGNSFGGLVVDAVGNLYGTMSAGGVKNRNKGCPSGCGVVFELSPQSGGSWTEKILHAFTGGQGGAFPMGGVTFDNTGRLLGTTRQGGDATCNCGMVFQLTPSETGGWTERVLHNFTGQGGFPQAPLTRDTAGNIYGVTATGGSSGYGAVFQLSPNSNGTWRSKEAVYSFTGPPAGAYPYGSVTVDASGNIYGITNLGGTASHGAVFKLSPNGSGGYSETVLHSFTGGADGFDPYSAGVTVDQAGNLFGPTYQGGNGNSNCFDGCGVVFEVTP